MRKSGVKSAKRVPDYIKAFARERANEYLKYSNIKKPCCQICGEAKTEMHHMDYAMAYFVNFLCRSCHSRVTHRELNPPNYINLLDLGVPINQFLGITQITEKWKEYNFYEAT